MRNSATAAKTTEIGEKNILDQRLRIERQRPGQRIMFLAITFADYAALYLGQLHARNTSMKSSFDAVAVALAATLCWTAVGLADGAGDPAAVKDEDGKYFDRGGNPTYKIQPDGTVDWYTYSGYRRYSAECLRCHGPDGSGSSYAPALTESLQTLSYNDFLGTVAAGKKAVNTAQDLVMPALGDDKNVMCYVDDIYIYLRARANRAIGPERPVKHEEKPEAATKWENSCMGG
jgi:methanol metabolism-related c-type cytochrome